MNTHTNANAATCRVVAPSSREALRLVREKLGPDAIVLSNKVTAQGVEIVAALEQVLTALTLAATHEPVAVAVTAASSVLQVATSDGDAVIREIHSMRGMIEEQLAGMTWSSAQRRDPVRGHLLRTLLGAGFSARLSKDILTDLPTGQSYSVGLAYIKEALERQLPVLQDEDAMMNEGGVYALMGPTGVGKTTTTAKLAARCVMRFGPEKLALVTTDSYRIGAYEQLRIYGQILGVSVHAVKDAADLELVLAELRDKHMVLIDTVGMSQRDRAVTDQIAMLCNASRPVKRMLLLNACSHGDTLNEVVQAYRRVGQEASMHDLVGCIFTKVDEATHPGVLLDMAIRHQLPVHYISSGQKVPEHLALCNPRLLVDSVFQARSPSALFVPGEADLDERPEALRNDLELRTAETISERLRSHCQQLIRALTHNAQELISSAAALSSGRIGFEETRTLRRHLQSDSVGIAGALQTLARTEIQAHCEDHVLLLEGVTGLTLAKYTDAVVHQSALLLSDTNGLPVATWHDCPTHPGPIAQGLLPKAVVHLLSAIPEAALIDDWQANAHMWSAGAKGSLRVIAADGSFTGTLAKFTNSLSFDDTQAATFRGKAALVSFADVLVRLRPDVKAGACASLAPLRCVIRRVVDAFSGKPLTHSYMLASTDVHATAQQMSQWSAWRSAAEPYFKLLSDAHAQLADGVASAETTRLQRAWVAGQVCITVLRLQQASQPWAQSAREVLTQLAGRAVRPGRPISAPVLLEGLDKFLVLLEAMGTDADTTSPMSLHAAANN